MIRPSSRGRTPHDPMDDDATARDLTPSAAFATMVEAHARGDYQAATRARTFLRALGWSVMPCPRPKRSNRS